jgi:DNA invertase Pin-like site-specific DNA recombinase
MTFLLLIWCGNVTDTDSNFIRGMLFMEKELSKSGQEEYDEVTQNAAPTYKPAVYGYSWVPSIVPPNSENSLESQEKKLNEAGVEIIYTDVYDYTNTSRPNMERLLPELRNGDTLVVTKLDRIAHSVQEGSELIKGLVDKGIAVRVLNLGNGPFDQSPAGKLMLDTMFSFAEFEKNLIADLSHEETKHHGKPHYSKEQIAYALELLNNSYSYADVVRMTGISRSTLARAKGHPEYYK